MGLAIAVPALGYLGGAAKARKSRTGCCAHFSRRSHLNAQALFGEIHRDRKREIKAVGGGIERAFSLCERGAYGRIGNVRECCA